MDPGIAGNKTDSATGIERLNLMIERQNPADPFFAVIVFQNIDHLNNYERPGENCPICRRTRDKAGLFGSSAESLRGALRGR